jgi:hypothetical protein
MELNEFRLILDCGAAASWVGSVKEARVYW